MVTKMRILYEKERRESEINSLEQERNLKAQKRKSLLIGSISLIIIGILVIVSLQNNIKKKKTIYEQNHRLSREKLKIQSLSKENLEYKLEFRMKELTNLALFISQRTSIYGNLMKSFKSLKSTDINQLKKDIKILMQEYSYKLDINEDI